MRRRRVAKGQRLPLAISVAALTIACTGVTPAEAVRAAKTAFASNSGKVNGIKASRTPKPNQLLPLDGKAKLPTSVLPEIAVDAGKRGPRGAEGPKGEPGPAGAKGDTGPRGPSNVITMSRSGIPLGNQPGSRELAAFELPAGDWLVLGTGTLVYEKDATNATFFRCWVTVGGAVVAGSTLYLGPGDPARPANFPGGTLAGSFSMQAGRQTDKPQSAAVVCGQSTSLTGNPVAEYVSLTAIRAESVDVR